MAAAGAAAPGADLRSPSRGRGRRRAPERDSSPASRSSERLIHGVDVAELGAEPADDADGRAPVHARDRVLDLAVLQAQGQRRAVLYEDLGAPAAPAGGGGNDSVKQPGVGPREVGVRHERRRDSVRKRALSEDLAGGGDEGSASPVLPGKASMDPSSK